MLKRRIKYLELAESRAKNPEWKKLWRDIINQLMVKEMKDGWSSKTIKNFARYRNGKRKDKNISIKSKWFNIIKLVKYYND